MPEISIIIPVRSGGSPYTTLGSLPAAVAGLDHEVIISLDVDGRGANWARNRGADLARGRFFLFSDDDIEWLPGSIAKLWSTLLASPQASYSYGSYEMDGRVQCDVPFDAARLRKANFVSTMSLIARADFPGFDEAVSRLQDWDLWLTMLERAKVGVYCGELIFRTALRDGITQNGKVSYEAAKAAVQRKHNL